MFYTVIILSIVLVAATVWLRRHNRAGNSPNRPESVRLSYTDRHGTFTAEGDKDEFILRKDDRFEFLVRKGVIVACKDKTRYEEFVYYEEEKT